MKIRIYLDTNMILDVFINHAKALKSGENALLPKKFEFMVANKEKLEFFTSFIVKAEVGRELSSAFGLSASDIELIWNSFIESLGCTYVESFTFDDSISRLAVDSQMKIRTLFNFMHVFIAMKNNCYFVSGDKQIVKKIKHLMNYDKAIDYIELRRIIEEEVI